MKWQSAAEEMLASLQAGGLTESEVYVKEGRSRRFELQLDVRTTRTAEELGWAVRAGGAGRCLFLAQSGEPKVPSGWPDPQSGSIALPPPLVGARWRQPAEVGRPLIGEGDAAALLERIERQADAALPGTRLTAAVIDDGWSEAEVVSSRGVRRRIRQRAAALLVEASRTRPRTVQAVHYVAERSAIDFDIESITHRIAEELMLAEGGPGPESEGPASCVLAPPVAARLLAGLHALVCGREAEEPVRRLTADDQPFAAPALTLVDDGRSDLGPLAAPWDGEGVPTRRVTLIERGEYRQPLLPWWQAVEQPELAAGCMHRPGWRDLPELSPSQLFIEPEPSVSAGELVASVERGYYWLAPQGGGTFDLPGDRFALPVGGFALHRGRGSAPIRRAHLHGSISGLFRGVRAVGRDLGFFPWRGLVGSPTLRVDGLDVSR